VFKLVENRRIYFTISGLAIGLSVVAMIVSWITSGAPFRVGVDFRSGSRFELQFNQSVTEGEIRTVFREMGFANPDVTSLGDPDEMSSWQVRTEFVAPSDSQRLMDLLSARIAPVDAEESSVQSVSPSVGAEVTRAAFFAVGIAAFVILLYIMFSFRQVSNPIRYGACAVVAMLHDLTIVFGFIAIMGLIAAWEVDALFLTAALTVAGFSLQDTIVVFDRIRENSRKRPHEKYELTVNRSVLETLHRSLTTQLSAMFVLAAIVLFGGASIRPFIAVLLLGLLSGTYSSLFNAVPLLVAWEKGEIPFLRAD
jgi:preprotein translocase SecF subunit